MASRRGFVGNRAATVVHGGPRSMCSPAPHLPVPIGAVSEGFRCVSSPQPSTTPASTWMPFTPHGDSDALTAWDGDGAESLLEDRRVLAELSESMLGHMNRIFAYAHHAIDRERVRHSSDISLLMRKVNKELKDSLVNVHKTFNMLTNQLSDLASEVERGKKQVTSIRGQFAKSRDAVEAQTMYVDELETVLSGQGQGLSDALRRLNLQKVAAQNELERHREKAKEREKALEAENYSLRSQLKRIEDEKQKAGAASQAERGVLSPPPLPEFAVSWTLRSASRSDGNGTWSKLVAAAAAAERIVSTTPAPNVEEEKQRQITTVMKAAAAAADADIDLVGGLLRCSDAWRNVPRSKSVASTARGGCQSSYSSGRASAMGGTNGDGRSSSRAKQRRRNRGEGRPGHSGVDSKLKSKDCTGNRAESVASSAADAGARVGATSVARNVSETPANAITDIDGDVLRRQADDWKRRAEAAEERSTRHLSMLGFATRSLQLLRCIFEELRCSWHIRTSDMERGEDGEQQDDATQKHGSLGVVQEDEESRRSLAPGVLDRIVNLFCSAIPYLGNFGDLLVVLSKELAECSHPETGAMSKLALPAPSGASLKV
eukprot:TRINITY_DN42938_c0_g1_i1.p1 TRINITY_DN42938_c0_g1~~TRINITY_DN42938_c0_g1_i1.p1  ORF type:complete len:631 (-),score=112.13 TRINITY_DN42938_c0_g1_i1:94-1902(-)